MHGGQFAPPVCGLAQGLQGVLNHYRIDQIVESAQISPSAARRVKDFHRQVPPTRGLTDRH